MADNYVNWLGGSPLNRLSWLRNSPPFLNSIIKAPSTRWVLFQNGQPLVFTPKSLGSDSVKQATKGQGLACLPTSSILSLLGPEPFIGQGQNDGENGAEGVSVLEAARLRGLPIVFLGVEEESSANENHTSSAGAGALPSSEFSAKENDAKAIAEKVKGTPYFALDVSGVKEEETKKIFEELQEGEFTFSEARSAAMGKFDEFEAAVFSEARSMLDWNTRNKFCPACGSPVYSLWAGWKLSCTSLLPWADNGDKPPCPSGKGLNNFAHPRSDPVVIMLAVDETGEKILMGHNRKFPGKFYSALAGFMEPGETFEDAVKREMWEEAGVAVWNVRYHSTQPWPFPANVMVGFYATADSSKPIRTDLDNELEDARWFTRQEILDVLSHPDGTNLSKRQERTPGGGGGALAHSDPGTQNPAEQNAAHAAKQNETSSDDVASSESKPLQFVVPPKTAIAGVLISEWAHGRITHLPPAANQRGNL